MKIVKTDRTEIDVNRDSLPYFDGVKPLKTIDVKTEFSPFFVFKHDTVLEVLNKKWSLTKYLKGLFKLKFKISNGYNFFFVPKKFYSPLIDPAVGQFMSEGGFINDEMGNYLRERPQKYSAYVKVPSKSTSYDFVLGEINDAKQITIVYQCRRINAEPIYIMRGTESDLVCQKIEGRIFEQL